MLICRNREKLINAIVYFAFNTRQCGQAKLFKLLYLLDFAHFRETGRSVTGLGYQAWEIGPVPLDLIQEWDDLESDMTDAIEIVPDKVIDFAQQVVVPKIPFHDSPFTRRELRLMNGLAVSFAYEMTKSPIEFTQEERGPWEKIWDGGRGKRKLIPYQLAVSDSAQDRDAIIESAREFKGIEAAAPLGH